ncbi:hypothetical protein, partial [Komagataeibacter europaeus]|uniref:hypothetical protein n=1 Tax=Komagataeibacter europaeus TaxID=33995 RepID=UPI0022314360
FIVHAKRCLAYHPHDGLILHKCFAGKPASVHATSGSYDIIGMDMTVKRGYGERRCRAPDKRGK